MKTYRVIIELLTTHEFDIEANTAEEAISVAEDELCEEANTGEITDTEIINADAFEEEEG